MSRIRNLYKFAKTVVKDYSSDNGSLIAAAVSYYVCLSLVPLGLLCLSIGAFFLGSEDQARSMLMGLARQYAPGVLVGGGSDITRLADQLVRERAAATGLTSLLFLWSGMSLMSSLSQAVNLAWDVESPRKFLTQRLIALVLLVSTLALLGLSFVSTAFIGVVKGLNISIFGVSPKDLPWVWSMLSYLAPLGITILAFALLYKLAPNVSVPLRAALLGGVFAGVLWELAKVGFSFYVSHVVSGASIYGSLGGLVLIVAWIHYSSIVTMLGAEVGSEYNKLVVKRETG
jgi:membrane protein